ncbi:hypothetical protein ACWGIB_08520 [Streptomyces xiamenensis]
MTGSRATAGLVALALALTLPIGSASAASGVFIYTPPPDLHSVTDPAPACLSYVDGVSLVNKTDQDVEVFTTPNCAGVPHVVPPGAPKTTLSFKSLRPVAQARGTLTYYTKAEPKSLMNPSSGICRDRAGEGPVTNATNATVIFYDLPGCPGTYTQLLPSQSEGTFTFQSFKFVE